MASQYDVEVEVVNKNVPIGCTIVDVGSNAGYFAKEFLDLGYTVISIEPLKEEIAKQVYRYNDYVQDGKLLLHNFACSSAPGTATMYVGKSLSVSSLEKRWWQETKKGSWSGQTVEVEKVRLCDLLSEYASRGVSPEFIKIDAEGHDYEVMLGLFELRDRQMLPKLIMFEIHTVESEREYIDKSVALLRQNGYSDFMFTIRHGERLVYVSDWLKTIGDVNAWDGPQGDIPAGYRYGNIIARFDYGGV